MIMVRIVQNVVNNLFKRKGDNKMNGKEFINIKEAKELVAKAKENPGFKTTGEGIILLKQREKGITSSGSPKITGVVANEDEINFNCWESNEAYKNMKLSVFENGNIIIKAKYEINKFGLVINSFDLVDGYSPDDFLSHKYDALEKENELYDAIKQSGATEKSEMIINKILHFKENDYISERFHKEYAAKSHHDNCSTGLLAHSCKCLQLYNGIKRPYKIFSDERINDLMVISLVIHDIGKIFEMVNGVYQKNSYVTHRGLGLEYYAKYKDVIVETYDEDFYYMIFSVIQQHHGEYGEEPRTLYAYIVHMIDDMESKMTSIDDWYEGRSENSEIQFINLDDKKLNI